MHSFFHINNHENNILPDQYTILLFEIILKIIEKKRIKCTVFFQRNNFENNQNILPDQCTIVLSEIIMKIIEILPDQCTFFPDK